ncbi:MAG: hypothetical protein SFY81_16975 [Verrucomicrobiota bacterium]|nr:hypothetical protein [Verrucomicrobiota bacterium]
MRQFLTIAMNAFMELIRQPIYLLILTTSASFTVFLSSVFYFGFGDDPKLVKDSTLAVMFLSGLFAAALSASSSVAHEIRTGTALAVMAKPVGRAQFLIAKYVGLASALTLLTYVNFLCSLLSSRMAFDAYGDPDKLGLKIFFGLLLLGYGIGGFSNYFLRRPFVADATFFVVLMISLSFIIINFFSREGTLHAWGTGVDWRLVPAAVLILFGLWVLAAVALACSTRLETIPTLAICSAVFLLGLMSDWLFGRPAERGEWWAAVLYSVVPNWQLVWLADALENGKKVPWSYVGNAFAYVLAYLGATLALALVMFEDRELT